MKKLIHTFRQEIAVTPEETTAMDLRKAVNRHFFGEENCNAMVEGKMVCKYEEHPAYPMVLDLHYQLGRNIPLVLELSLFDDGSIEAAVAKETTGTE